MVSVTASVRLPSLFVRPKIWLKGSANWGRKVTVNSKSPGGSKPKSLNIPRLTTMSVATRTHKSNRVGRDRDPCVCAHAN